MSSPDHGSAEDVLDVGFDADDFQIGYNARYLATKRERMAHKL